MVEARKRVVIVGGGFAGLNAAKQLGRSGRVAVSLIDRRNHHLFQPLLYQVAMAGLSPAEIAVPIRALLSGYRDVTVIQGEVRAVDLAARRVSGEGFAPVDYDYLLLATGVQHAYFGHEQWEPFAPGLKTLEQATEIRRRVLTAFERAEVETDPEQRKRELTFAIVGGGPTGVELAGAIGEMSRFTLARDFHNIDPKLTRVILIEAGPRILPSFVPELASRATRDLESLGVQVWTNSRVTAVDASGVQVGDERIATRTVLWAAGVRAAESGVGQEQARDAQGRLVTLPDLSLPGHPEVFALGDLAHAAGPSGSPLPGIAPVALQQGRYAAATILAELRGRPRAPFVYQDKGQMATIGRSRAIAQLPHLRLTGWVAWLGWLTIHIYYLSGFKNRLFVLIQWAWSYLTFARGARLIVEKTWRFYPDRGEQPGDESR
ncbi:MAG: NAD(P)/FAD-dependent oxidoreductase [Polyangiales bacterium]